MKNRQLSHEECLRIASKFTRKNDLKKADNSVYKKILEQNWQDCFIHMNPTRHSTLLDQLRLRLLKIQSINELLEKEPQSYKFIRKNKLFNLIAHFNDIKDLSHQIAINESRQYKTINLWAMKSPQSYIKANIENWADCFAHFIKNNQHIEYSKDKCKEIAQKYPSREFLQKEQQYVYRLIIKNKWDDDCFSHMKKYKKIKPYKETVTHLECKEIALQYKTKKEWRKNNKFTYMLALRKKWVDCFSHFPPTKKEIFKTKEACVSDARKHLTRKEWLSSNPTAYYTAIKNNWDECFAHMIQKKVI